jgi:hypothetical protein
MKKEGLRKLLRNVLNARENFFCYCCGNVIEIFKMILKINLLIEN